MSDHTPAPWRAEKHPLHDHVHRSELWTIIAGEPDDCCDAEIAQVIAYEAEANARLIAAAPDLLNALNVCLGWITGGLDGDWADVDPAEVARAAIRKAKGEE